MPEQKYKDELAISQSMIKSFKSMPPIEFKKLWITGEKQHKTSDALDRGSLTDDLLFNPSCVEDKYIICEGKKPSDAISFIVEKTFLFAKNLWKEDVDKIDISSCRNSIIENAKLAPMLKGEIGYGQKWKEDTIIDKVSEEGSDYFEFLKSTKGKTVISNTDYMACLMMAETCKNSEIVGKYFLPENNQFQVEIVTEGEFPYNSKGCIDILHVNHERREIQEADFKTAESAFYFTSHILKFGYLEQTSFYDNLIHNKYIWNPESEYYLYKLLPPINIVIDKFYNIPYIYEYNFKDMDAAWNGYTKYGRYQKGLEDYIKEIRWHVINDKWNYPIEHYMNNKISLDLIHHK